MAAMDLFRQSDCVPSRQSGRVIASMLASMSTSMSASISASMSALMSLFHLLQF